MVNIRQIAEMGAYVSLLEYNNIGKSCQYCLLFDIIYEIQVYTEEIKW